MEYNTKRDTSDSRYFDELLVKIRDIRNSEHSAARKITEIIASTIDYDGMGAFQRFAGYANQLKKYGVTERFANRLQLYAETAAKGHQVLTGKDVEELAHDFINDISFKQDIYDFPCYPGVFEDDENGGHVSLPQELQNFKGNSMILKIEDMDRFVDTFCNRNTYYRRAYDILADLDKIVLECVEKGVFPQCEMIPYKDCGFALFEFSHFEVDLREPDENYRTLYVVYRYDTTAS